MEKVSSKSTIPCNMKNDFQNVYLKDLHTHSLNISSKLMYYLLAHLQINYQKKCLCLELIWFPTVLIFEYLLSINTSAKTLKSLH